MLRCWICSWNKCDAIVDSFTDGDENPRSPWQPAPTLASRDPAETTFGLHPNYSRAFIESHNVDSLLLVDRENFGRHEHYDCGRQRMRSGTGRKAEGATPEGCVATITSVTAQSIAEAYKRFGPPGCVNEVDMGGGGSNNPNIVNYPREQLPQASFTLIDETASQLARKRHLDLLCSGLRASLVGL